MVREIASYEAIRTKLNKLIIGESYRVVLYTYREFYCSVLLNIELKMNGILSLTFANGKRLSISETDDNFYIYNSEHDFQFKKQKDR